MIVNLSDIADEDVRPTRFGVFISPIHAPDENANLALHRDIQLIRYLDKLGFHEAWMGEHHSTGWEFVGSPEIFLAHVAAQTRNIRLGTGVVSVPYHHPYHVAERFVALDHLTRGRVSLGLGPGALVGDAVQFGIDPKQTRTRLEEGLETILRLLEGKRISRKADWFTLNEAKLQLLPYSDCPEIAVTASVSPAGARLAGIHGCSLLSLTATNERNTTVLADHWRVVTEQSKISGKTVSRKNWRLVGPMHLAETKEQAYRDVEYGLRKWAHYITEVALLPVLPRGTINTPDLVQSLISSGYAVIGTPDQAVEQINRIAKLSGGYGTFLLWSHDWASRDATFRSFELFARHVMPRFNPINASLAESEAYAMQHADEFSSGLKEARTKAIADYAASRHVKP